jgi:DNA-binding Xre family transcriptional regulator
MSDKKKTKLHKILHEREMSVKDLQRALEAVGEKIEYYQLTEFRNGVRTNYTTETLYKLCKALDCTPNDIEDWSEKPQPKAKRPSQKSEVELKVEDNVSENGDDEIEVQAEEEADWGF